MELHTRRVAMKCKCGKEVLFLIDGLCKECRDKGVTNRKSTYVIRIHNNWFYCGGHVTKQSRLPAKVGIRKAKAFKSKGPASKVAALYGGVVEEIK